MREGIPESGWVTADEYLSGNVREKLHTAQKAAEADAAYVVNVSALEQVQPAPVEAGDIEVHLGATWIPVDVVKDFMVELLEPSWNAAAVMEAGSGGKHFVHIRFYHACLWDLKHNGNGLKYILGHTHIGHKLSALLYSIKLEHLKSGALQVIFCFSDIGFIIVCIFIILKVLQ